MEDHPVKRRRIEEPAEAAQATVAQTVSPQLARLCEELGGCRRLRLLGEHRRPLHDELATG